MALGIVRPGSDRVGGIITEDLKRDDPLGYAMYDPGRVRSRPRCRRRRRRFVEGGRPNGLSPHRLPVRSGHRSSRVSRVQHLLPHRPLAARSALQPRNGASRRPTCRGMSSNISLRRQGVNQEKRRWRDDSSLSFRRPRSRNARVRDLDARAARRAAGTFSAARLCRCAPPARRRRASVVSARRRARLRVSARPGRTRAVRAAASDQELEDYPGMLVSCEGGERLQPALPPNHVETGGFGGFQPADAAARIAASSTRKAGSASTPSRRSCS